MNKEGYTPFIMVYGTPKISITHNGVYFNSAIVRRLNYSKFVNLYFNDKEKLFAIEPAKTKDIRSCEFYQPRPDKSVYVRINNKDLLMYISGLMQWDLSKHRFDVEGVTDYKEGNLEFDLKKAQEKDDKWDKRQR